MTCDEYVPGPRHSQEGKEEGKEHAKLLEPFDDKSSQFERESAAQKLYDLQKDITKPVLPRHVARALATATM